MVTQDRQAPSRLPNLLLLAGVLLGCLVAVELLLSHYYLLGNTIYQLDRRYLHRQIPNSRKRYRHTLADGGKTVLVTINSQGRRGEIASAERPNPILVYGDSFIAAEFSPLEETFVCQLEERLKRRLASPPQVINCGVSGYGPDQASLVMEDEIDQLKPKLVIVSITATNDFGDLLRNKIYKLDEQKQLTNNQYTLDPCLVSEFASAQSMSPVYTFRLVQMAWRKWGPADSSTTPCPPPAQGGNLLEEWLRRGQAEYEDYVIHGNNRVSNLMYDHYDADVSMNPRGESSQYKRILMERVIEKMQRVAAARSIPMLLMVIPSQIDVQEGYWLSVDTGKYKDYHRAELTDIVEEIARKHQLPYVNLFRPFRERGAGSLFFRSNNHWNAAGQQLAASLVTEYIVQNGLLAAR